MLSVHDDPMAAREFGLAELADEIERQGARPAEPTSFRAEELSSKKEENRD